MIGPPPLSRGRSVTFLHHRGHAGGRTHRAGGSPLRRLRRVGDLHMHRVVLVATRPLTALALLIAALILLLLWLFRWLRRAGKVGQVRLLHEQAADAPFIPGSAALPSAPL
jgi:hypothetical protein